MPQVTVFDMSGNSVGEMSLSDAIFGIEPNQPVQQKSEEIGAEIRTFF